MSANYTPKEARTQQQIYTLRLSDEFIAELAAADEYVIGLPMHNFGPPCKFKLWVDQIERADSSPQSISDRFKPIAVAAQYSAAMRQANLQLARRNFGEC